MSRPKRWKVLASERLQDCTVFSVSRLLSRSPRDGSSHAFFRIEAGDWVNVVPVTPSGEIVMVRQYRHGSDAITLEIPGGMVDPGETPAAAAGRELLEETGYRASRVAPIGCSNPNPALFGNRLHCFVARDCERVAEVSNDGTEETVVELVALSAVPRLVREGVIDHALVLAGLLYYQLCDGP